MVEKVSGANDNVMPTQVLRVARRTAYYVARARVDRRYHRATDAKVLEQIRAVRNSRAVRLPPRLGNGDTALLPFLGPPPPKGLGDDPAESIDSIGKIFVGGDG